MILSLLSIQANAQNNLQIDQNHIKPSILLTTQPSKQLTELIEEGDLYQKNGQFELAQKSFEKAIEISPNSVQVLMKLAAVQLLQQDFLACIGNYQKAIGLDSKNAKAWLGLGFSYLHTGKSGLSSAAFNEAIRIEPSYKEKLAPILEKLNRN